MLEADSANAALSKPKLPQLQIQQVDVVTALGNQYLLQNISFEVFAGDRIGIIGVSGSGKTTLLRLLNRLSDPTSGHIAFEQKPLSDWPILSLRRQIMLVPPEPKLLGMTVQEALNYPLRLQNIPDQTLQTRVLSWRQRLGIADKWLSSTELQLSMGQRQLVSLARTCLSEPQICLLDEPTSALDPGSVERIAQGLTTSPMTLLIASHQFEFLAKVCDRILWLHQGQLHRDAPLTQINWSEVQAQLATQAQAEQAEWE
jgi:D-methionine transport system ATP-binding protein